MKRVSSALRIAAAALVLWLPQSAAAASIITFDVPGAISTRPLSINRYMATTGLYMSGPGYCDQHGFVRAPDGTVATFDPPVAPGRLTITQPAAINDAGAVAGWYLETDANCSNGAAHGFLRDAAGAITAFDFSCCTDVTGLNNGGAIIGNSVDFVNGKFVYHGVLRAPDGQLTMFDVSGRIYTLPASVNDNGAIAGSALDDQYHAHGFLRDPQGNITQFDVPGATETNPLGINGANTIVGYCRISTDTHGFTRSADGTIALLDIPNSTYTQPQAIDRHGRITGTYGDNNGAHGFLRKVNGRLVTFDTPAGSNTEALAISQGAVTGSSYDTNNMQHGYLRTP